MFASRRVVFKVPRHRAAWARPIASICCYSTQASAAQTTPVTSSSTSTSTESSSSSGSKPAASSTPKPTPKPAPRATLRQAAPAPKKKTPPPPSKPNSSAPPPPVVDKPSKPLRLPTAAKQASDASASFDHGVITAPSSLNAATGQVLEVKDIDWEKSFHGIGTRPVTQEQFDILMRPLKHSDIEVKPDGVIYLPEIKYRRRLNEAFGPMGWGLIPRGEAVVGDSIVTREYALIIDGRFVSQAQGENNYFGADQLPSAVEGCKSNALMRCCKDLGIASELWDPLYIRWFKQYHMQEVWVEHMVTKKKRTLWYRAGAVDVSYPYKLAQ